MTGWRVKIPAILSGIRGGEACILLGGEPGYSSIVRDFGRHPIQDWTAHRVIHGKKPLAQARSLTMRTIPGHRAVDDGFSVRWRNGTLCRITAVDATIWNLIQVELSQTEPDYAQPGVTIYEVLHVSTAQAQPDRSA